MAAETSREEGQWFARRDQPTDLFVLDRISGQAQTVRLERGSCSAPRFSADGQRLVFVGSEGPTHLSEVYLKKGPSAEPERLLPPHRVGGHASSFAPDISADGRWVSLLTYRPLPGNDNWAPTLALAEVTKETTVEVPFTWKVSTNSGRVALSPDGSRLAWENRQLTHEEKLTTRLVVHTRGESPLTIAREAGEPSLSRDTCAFVQSDEAGIYQLALYDFRDRTTRVLTQADEDCLEPAISSDGKRVVFTSYASNLTSGQVDGPSQVYLLEVSSGRIRCLSSGGKANSYNPTISADGSTVAFVSLDSTLGEEKLQGGQIYLWQDGWERCRSVNQSEFKDKTEGPGN